MARFPGERRRGALSSIVDDPAAGARPAPGPDGADPAPVLPSSAQVWLVRHGETEWSRSGQHTGRTDIDLTEHGVAQAIALRPMLAGLDPVLVLCSPRWRARRTAELAGLAVTAIDDDLSEWDYGDYEGLTSAEIRQRDPGWTVWTGRVPNGETAEQVGIRADRLWARVRPSLAAGPVVLFGHGHINRVLAARWLQLEVRRGGSFTLGTAAPCRLGVEHRAPVIVQWNISNPAT